MAISGLALLVALAAPLAEASTTQLTTRVSPSKIDLGSSFHDTATVTTPSPSPTGSVRFYVYGPDNPTCDSEGPVAFSSNATLTPKPGDPNSGVATSARFTPTALGTYHVIASYFPDNEIFQSASTNCGDPGETVSVIQPFHVTGGGGAPPPPPPPGSPPPPPTPPGTPGTPPTGPPTGPGGPGGMANDMPLIATADVINSTSANLSSTIDPHGLPTTMHFEYSWSGGVTASAFTILYTSRTPEQTVGADFSNHTVLARVSGLLPNSIYHLRAVAANAAGVTKGTDTTFRTPKDPPPPPPVLGRLFNAEPISGAVRVLTGHGKGAHFVPLTEPRQLPVGTVFDTTGGLARLTSATAKRGKTQSGNFTSGLFKVLQNRRELGLTELDLVVPSRAAKLCAAAGKAQTAAKKALPKSVLSLLRATVKGKYRTRGRFSSATVRGTVFTTADRCDGTFTLVKRGVVVVTDRRLHRNVVLRAGRSYLAKAP